MDRKGAAGVDLVVVSRKAGACSAGAEQIRSTTGGGPAVPRRALGPGRAWPSDVYDLAERVEVLADNTGMSPVDAHVGTIAKALFDRIVGANLQVPFQLTAAVARLEAESDIRAVRHRYCRSVGRLEPDLVRSRCHADAVDRRGAFAAGPDRFERRYRGELDPLCPIFKS